MTREEAISAIQSNRPTSGYTMLCEALDMAVSALREQGERRWIPVTERLPESEGTYLVYTKRGSVYASHFYEKKVFRDGYVREQQWSQRGEVKVTHWMPLPEPPREGTP